MPAAAASRYPREEAGYLAGGGATGVYGAVLSAGRMRSLEARMPATLEAFRNQIRSFLAWMLGGE